MRWDGSIELAQSFVVVAEELSFRRGAERLNLDQSALTRRIQKLEHQLGFKLLERTTREVALTPAGRSFYEANLGLIREYGRAVESARFVAEGKTGELRLAYMSFAATLQMPRLVSRYRALCPHVALKLSYIRTQGQKLALANGEIDLGLMIGPFEHPDFETLKVANEPLCLITSRDHPIAQARSISPRELAEHEFVVGDMTEWQAYRWRLTDLFSSEGLTMKVALEASNPMALLGLVAAGLGVTIYPESLAGFVGERLAFTPIDDPRFRLETILAWKRGTPSEAARTFVELVRKENKATADYRPKA
ncbi:LysR family transcriptional regulator [Bradyrhizobium sp.]|uniref:LysR family transcriptional regulator n=1 Tax=Bradyrhizobium sp. TaxID=376 RepID=UPI0039E6C795